MLSQVLPTARSYTRMIERSSLAVLHATLEASLPEGTCSLILCPPAQKLFSHHPIP